MHKVMFYCALRYLIALSLVSGLIVLPAPLAVRAAAITVTTTDDSIADDGSCSLREAIIAANTNIPSGSSSGECPAGSASGTDAITVPAGVYTLTRTGRNEDAALTGDLDVRGSVNIVGASMGNTIVQASTDESITGIDRVFDLVSGSISLSDMTIQFGYIDANDVPSIGNSVGGGGIVIRSNVTTTVQRCAVTKNTTASLGGRATFGAGIFHSNRLMMRSSIVTENRNIVASSGDGTVVNGGGIAMILNGSLTLESSQVSNNSSAGVGGGIYVFTNNTGVTIKDSTVASNNAMSGGGVFSNGSSVVLERAVIAGNAANGGVGGGLRLFDAPVTTFGNTSIRDNTASEGGGIATSGRSTLGYATFSNNRATSGAGGAIRAYSAPLTVAGTLFVGNSAAGDGGAIYAQASESTFTDAIFTNATFSDNAATGSGGALFIAGVNVQLTNVTLADNSTGISGMSSGLVRNTLLANRGANCQNTTLPSRGSNLSTDASCTAFSMANKDLQNVAPNIGPLADNGGLTKTHALLPNSPAINRGGTSANGCPATDQRGSGRPVGVACDIGAYELASLPPPAIGGSGPDSGPEAGGNTLTLTGQGFYVGTSVSVGGNSCTNLVLALDASQLTCTVPAGTTGARDVSVVVPSGGIATRVSGYYYGTRPNVAPPPRGVAPPNGAAPPAPPPRDPGVPAGASPPNAAPVRR